MNVIAFDYVARFGHFLRAEAGNSGITYPVPPRTVLLGLIGAVLGLEKDQVQQTLVDAEIAVGGSVPRRFWHRTNVRKDPPRPLPRVFKLAKKKGNESESSEKPEKNYRFSQEWLWRPCYRVWVSLPDPFLHSFAERLKHRRWHFSPCMGLSELLADLRFVDQFESLPAASGLHAIGSVVKQDAGTVEVAEACRRDLAIQHLRMPRCLTLDRVFAHTSYFVERDGKPIPLVTDQAWHVGQDNVVFL